MRNLIVSMLCFMLLVLAVPITQNYTVKSDCITLGQGDSGVPIMVQDIHTTVPEIALITPENMRPFDYGANVVGLITNNKQTDFKNFPKTDGRYRMSDLVSNIGKYKQYEQPLHFNPGSVNEVKRV